MSSERDAAAAAPKSHHHHSKSGFRYMVRIVVGFAFLLNYLQSNVTRLQPSPPHSESPNSFNKEKCAAEIDLAVDSFRRDNAHLRIIDDISHALELIMDPTLRGDILEVSLSEIGSTCSQEWTSSLLMAVAQRAANASPFCAAHNRAVWLAFQDDSCVDTVKKIFRGQSFHVMDSQQRSHASFSVDVPVFLVVGTLPQTLPDIPVEDVAFLRISDHQSTYDHDTEALRRREKDALIALFSLYRRVHIGGYVSLDGVWDIDGVKEFFTDAELNKQNITSSPTLSSILFKKENTHIRIPPRFRKDVITRSVDRKVLEAWTILDRWHRDTVRKFFGHVGTNPYQSYRYIEALQHVVKKKKTKLGGGAGPVTVNVCETGFNGGHSAMLFLSFLERGSVNINYWGWDLKQVGSASPIADKMTERYGSNFHIVWGDSKETLKVARELMGDERCDFIVVDGDHSKQGVVSDLGKFLKVASPGAVVFGDDCAPYKRTVPKSEEMLNGWMEFVEKGQIVSVANYRNPDLPSPGFVEGLVPPSIDIG